MLTATKTKRTRTAEQVFSQVHGRAEKIKSDAASEIEVMDVGDEVRQGDIYVTRIEKIPADAILATKPDRQMAPGTSQGSRHTVRSLDGVKLYRLRDAGPLDGPIIEMDQPTWLDHPEHGDRCLPSGKYAVTYQRAFAEELRAVLD